uniref:Uncharacterized protein n=1 Tax=Physcomitrium patens TaxID=3218 RepID=A0A2K1JM18_PHYPA|nr:hypothetical protein PHYPA_017420 [Physcomitrium patens]
MSSRSLWEGESFGVRDEPAVAALEAAVRELGFGGFTDTCILFFVFCSQAYISAGIMHRKWFRDVEICASELQLSV